MRIFRLLLYFEGNYTWSLAVNLALTAGGDLGQIDQFLNPLRNQAPDSTAWTAAWDALSVHQALLAERDLDQGYQLSASSRFIRAAIYQLTGERQTAPGVAKMRSYQDALVNFRKGIELLSAPLERVEVPSPDGLLPGYIIPAQNKVSISSLPPPMVIFYNGFDVTKEILYGIIRNTFSDRGISCLVIDGPGTGEPLRLRNVVSRHDYEVPTSAIVDYIVSQRDPIADPSRLGLVGISLGGYYAPRGAAFDHRIKAVAAWGAIYDYGATWRNWRAPTTEPASSVPRFQLPWVMGTLPTDACSDPEVWEVALQRAVDRVAAFRLQDALSHLTQSFLIVHGEKDSLIPVEDAKAVFAAAASTDKELKIFTEQEGGSEHVQVDDPDPCRQLIADWFERKL